MMELFFELIRVAIGTQDRLSRIPTEREWAMLFRMAQKQSLVGICFAAIERLRGDDCIINKSSLSREDLGGSSIPHPIYLRWLGVTAKIQQRNELLDAKTQEALAFFREKGFPCVALKGQGIAKLYGSLSTYRQSGDVDIWTAGGRERIYLLSRDVLGKITGANYHHIHFPMWEDPEIELHIYPSFLSSPLRNHRLHQFCRLYDPSQVCDDTPPLAFNLVFIMLHCYRHLCGHGVGMRQVMDYYFVLKDLYESSLAREDRDEAMRWVERLGMKRFAPALMWVMKDVFGLKDEYLLCEPNEEEGRFLLNEIMNTGNMGHAETRFRWGQKSALGRYVAAQKRNLHLMTHYPHEVLWSPLFNIWRFFWLKTKGL